MSGEDHEASGKPRRSAGSAASGAGRGRSRGRRSAGRGSKGRKRGRKASQATATTGAEARDIRLEARRLGVRELRWRCPSLTRVARRLAKEVEDEPDQRARRRRRRAFRVPVELSDFVGQETAIASLQMALGLDAPGANIALIGPAGSGRRSLLEAVERVTPSPFPRPRDRLLVYDFELAMPRLITLPRGQGRRFVRDLEDLFLLVRRALRMAFEGDDTLRRRDRLLKRQEQREREILGRVVEKAGAEGFAIPQPLEGEVLFTIDRHRFTRSQLEAALEKGILKIPHRKRKMRRHEELETELRQAQLKARETQRGTPRQLRLLERAVIERATRGFIEDLIAQYPTESVRRYAEALPEGWQLRLEPLLDEEEGDDAAAFHPFRVNVLVDARRLEERPLVHVTAPTRRALFGTVEGEGASELPEFLRVRAGALLKAEGGVLVLAAREPATEAGLARDLRRCLSEGRLPLPVEAAGADGPPAVKVVMLCEEYEYQLLMDERELGEAFRVRVELRQSVERSSEAIESYAAAIWRGAGRHGLLRPDAGALERLLEEAARRTSRRGHLELQISELLDLLREAEAPARARAAPVITREDIEAALEARRRRVGRHEAMTLELISEGVVLIDASGRRCGQVNALVIYDDGEHAFARPCRITATVSPGGAGLIDIERESRLSGEAHHKGIQIISGLLRDRYGRDKPLALTAGLCFEQSYSHIDGDSASAAEVIALLSALARVPVRQSLAISGSVNQLGDLQAVGGVNEKIEGFFHSCQGVGLTGDQGVVIPEANVADLMLAPDVIEAIRTRRFHVYAAATLDEALTLLTGLEAGTRQDDEQGTSDWQEGSVNRRVDERLAAMGEAWRRLRGDP